MTYVTCPTLRYHPAVVAQKAATLQILAEGRFTLGLGSGENLNEHVVGEGWPAIDGPRRTCSPRRSRSSARCTPVSWSTTAATTSRSTPPGSGTCPTSGVDIGVAVAGDRVDRAVRAAGRPPGRRRAEGRPRRALERRRRRAADRRAARARSARSRSAGTRTRTPRSTRAHEQFRWFGGGWSVNADLPTTGGLRRRDASSSGPRTSPSRIPCGPDLDAVVEAVSAVLGGRVHRRRARADRRRGPGPVPRRGGRPAAGEAAGGRPLSPAWLRVS